MSTHPPGGGGGGGAPPHLQDDRAPPDLDPAVVDAILNLLNAHLDANRSFNNLDEIPKLIRNFDPADDIVDKVEKLCLEENKPGEQEPAWTNGPSSSTETESPILVQGGPLDHAPSDLDPATLEEIRRLDPAVLDKMLKLGPLILDQIRNQKAVSFPPGECWTYLRTGTCKNKSNCKFKHPPRSKDKQVSKDKAKEKEELAGKPDRTQSKNDFKSEGCKNGKASKSNHSRGQPSVTPVGENFMGLPIPPVSKDKAKEKEGLAKKPGRPESKNDFKSKGSKNGKASKSNHSRGQPSVAPVGENFMGFPIPLVSKDKEKKKEELAQKPGRTESKVSKDKAKEKEAEKPGRTESKNEFRSQGCKNGKAGTSNHSKGQPSVAPVGERFMGVPLQPVSKDKAKDKEAEKPGRAEIKNDFRSEGRKNAKVRTSNHSRGQPSVAPAGENFLGLPIRPGKKNCPYYMQNGSCKYVLSCKYNHPDPEAAGESHPVSRDGNGGPATFQGASPSPVEPSSARRSLNKTPHYVPPMVIPPSQWGPSQNTELNSYQAPANLPERSMPVPQPYGIDNSVTETTTYQQDPLEKRFLLVCNSSAYCHKSNCNYHHPKYQTSVSPSCELSEKGLPLRPGQNICTQYSTYGICNSGPSCKFDHPSSPTFTL